MASEVLLYVFDSVVEDYHSISISRPSSLVPRPSYLVQTRPVRMLSVPHKPFRVRHKTQDSAGGIRQAGY